MSENKIVKLRITSKRSVADKVVEKEERDVKASVRRTELLKNLRQLEKQITETSTFKNIERAGSSREDC